MTRGRMARHAAASGPGEESGRGGVGQHAVAQRAVITGLGAVTPSGVTAEQMWAEVVAGRSAVRVLEGEQFASLPVRIGAQITNFSVPDAMPQGVARRLSPVQLWAIAAADEALRHATGTPENQLLTGAAQLPWNTERTSVIVATGSGPVDAQQAATRAFDARGPRAVPLTLAVYGSPDSVAAQISLRYQLHGASQAVSATCASGAVAIGEAMRRIRHGYADAVIVVGMEDCLNEMNLSANANMRSLATGYEAAPETASRPFDRGRSGFVMGQGAAAVVIESEVHARSRGATVLAEVLGFGASSDAHHATAPHPEGAGAARAVRECLRDAGADAREVEHINAHGTGTPAGDSAELLALEAALGQHAREIPITATKSSTGHLLGAAGVLEAVIAVQTMRDGQIPPTLNLENPEFAGWDFVRGSARAARPHTVLSTSFGFGGHSAALLLGHTPTRTTTGGSHG